MIVLKSVQDQYMSGIVEHRHNLPRLTNAFAQCSITNGMVSGNVTEGECSESTGADGAPAAKAGDGDGGESDGEPAPRHPRHSKQNRPRKAQNPAPLPCEPQPLAALPCATAQPKVNLTAPPPPAALWRLPEVLRNVPVSRATLYAWIEQGRFPKPIKIGARAVAWRSEQVLAFAAQ